MTGDRDHTLLQTLIANPPMARELPAFDPDGAPATPAPLFTDWLLAAFAAGVPDPQVVALATVDADGIPDSRVLVLRGVDGERTGFAFWTDADSAKARQLSARPAAALTVYWPALGRQVRARGEVTATGTAPNGQAAYALWARTVEFWQGHPERRHVRLRYTAGPSGWTRELLEP